YGAGNKKRIMQTYRAGVVIAVIIMFAGLLIFQLKTADLLLLFNASDQMLEIGVPALRTISLSFTFAGYAIITGSMFQALGNGVYSLMVSVARQLFCLVPAAWILARMFGLDAVWYSFAIAEIVSVIMTTILMIRIYRKKILNLKLRGTK
nr:MATE family efflux transporter [Clostridium sp.]